MRVRRALILLTVLATASCKRSAPTDVSGPLRLGFFPNVTHAQALVGTAGKDFESALGGRLTTRQFNAGPAAMEALLAGDLDVSYVGPGPAVIAFLRSEGAVRVIAGAASGGAVLVVRDAKEARDLRGKRVASPQLGNTQDIALRTWLRRSGVEFGEGPEQVHVFPLANSDILHLFQRGDLAAAWVPEPWGARLVAEAGARILVDERDLWPHRQFPTTVLVASRAAIERRRGDLVALLRAHVALTDRWRGDQPAFARAANAEYGRITGHPLTDGVLLDAFSRLEPTLDPLRGQLVEGARASRELGFAPEGDLSTLVDTTLLDEARGPRAKRAE
ncbi:MAG TPA: ABC transporter substrate-binding protein [Anaeromyxobacteraceae bacterium]|nr:ABC transporter substrate-binding protein [Anaeromyxobacteraceae bacterium]